MDVKADKKRGITMGKAILKLHMFVENGMVTVHVLKARHLSSTFSTEPCQSFVEVSLEPDATNLTRCRTNTRPDRHPIFNEQFSFELNIPDDCKKRVYVSVWNCYLSKEPSRDCDKQAYKDPSKEQIPIKLEFMGCMSFGVHHVLSETKEVSGWYYLLRDGIGRRKHLQAILNSVIYSEAGDIRQPGGNPGNDEQHDFHGNQEKIRDNRLSHRPLANTPYEHVTENCKQIIQDITFNSHRNSHMQRDQSPSAEEDTYTTFVFTKSPLHPNTQNSFAPNKCPNMINGDLNAKEHQQCTHADQDENDYVKMYPPKSWRQSGYNPNSTEHKPIKQVGFTDLVNSENIRGLPESRRFKNRCMGSSERLVDISELDTQGYMSLSQVRREEDTIYASIEPLNGSYMHDNASEISEFTYSKTISKASKALYPHLNRTPIPSRKALHSQNQLTSSRGYYGVSQNQRVCQENRVTQALQQDDSKTEESHAKDAMKPRENIKTKYHTQTLSPKSDHYWCDNSNIHNDSGIADHDSSPVSDCECSDNNMHFVYKPNQDIHTTFNALQSTPKAQRKNPSTPNIDRKVADSQKYQRHVQDITMPSRKIPGTPQMPRSAPGTPKVQRHPAQMNQPVDMNDIQVYDCPRWMRGEKSRIVCTNDSCVEDNDTSGMAHTPSCPYHVCTNCNGIVPHSRACADNHCSYSFTQSQNNQFNNQPMHKTQLMSRRQVGCRNELHAEDHYSEGTYSVEDGSSEDDFGYMSMEKFNIYKDTVLKHHKGALQCEDHETTTKIYFL